MNKTLAGEKLAVLLSNGFNETDLTELQKALVPLGVSMRIISMDRGLVNSWNGKDWGLSFASDKALNESLAVDYSMLIIPGGARSIEKLKLTAHTRRFINGFIDSGKPVVAMGESADLLTFIGQSTEGNNVMIGSMAQPDFMSNVVEFFQSFYALEKAA